MQLESLSLTNFKSYESKELTFHPKVNLFVGPNGAGKTNLLDAIYYLSFCKSYFASQDSYSMKLGSDFFAIHGQFRKKEENTSTKISCLYKNNRKVMRANQKDYERLSDHIGLCPLIMISPYDSDIINNGSEVRRKFFDMFISQCDKPYLQYLIQYQKIIQQRNSLLKQMAARQSNDFSLLAIYDEQLAPFAQQIFDIRKLFITQILPDFQKYYNFLSDGKENVGIQYQSQLEKESYQNLLNLSKNQDIKMGYTTVGTHKDDFIFTKDGQALRRFGSQGQQKSFTLALKLAQFNYIKRNKLVMPLLLLDDIFDKLDLNRIGKILKLVGDQYFGQVFITDTNKEKAAKILNSHSIEHLLFEI